MLIFPTGFFSKPGFYYINIAKKCTKIHVFGKIAFWGWKNAFYPKTKVVPKTLSYCKMDKKIKFKKKSFRGVRGSWIWLFWAFFCQFWDPTDPPKNNIFWKLTRMINPIKWWILVVYCCDIYAIWLTQSLWPLVEH